MKFVAPHPSLPDRVGGRPTHVPSAPVCDRTGAALAFVAQFYAHPDRLRLPANVACIQIYQRCPVDDPEPLLIPLPADAATTGGDAVRTNPKIAPMSVDWEVVEEPDDLPPFDAWGAGHELAARSKAGGNTINAEGVPDGHTFLLQLREEPNGLNFGGFTVVVSEGPDGQLVAQLA